MTKIKKKHKNSELSSEFGFEHKLITAVKKYSCLYNKKSISYRSRAEKKKAWRKVAKDVRSDVKECADRWRSLRDRYVREMRSNANSKWIYVKQLSFLQGQYDLRRNCNTADSSNLTVTEEELCSNSEAKTTIVNDEKTKLVKETGPGIPVMKSDGENRRISNETELEIEDSDKEMEKSELTNDQLENALNSLLTIDIDGLHAVDPLAFVAFLNGGKNTRMDTTDMNERSDTEMVSEVNQLKTEKEIKSRNEDYYKTLDSYLLQLPFGVQDDLKIEILNRVYCEVLERKIQNT